MQRAVQPDAVAGCGTAAVAASAKADVGKKGDRDQHGASSIYMGHAGTSLRGRKGSATAKV